MAVPRKPNPATLLLTLAAAMLSSCRILPGELNYPTRNTYLIVDRIKDQVLEHAPYKQYKIGTSETQFGRTPGAACEAIRFLYRYYTNRREDRDVYEKVLSIADFLLSIQASNPADIQYGGFPAQPDTGSPGVDPTGIYYFYSIEAALCGEALLRAYQISGDTGYRDAALNASVFLRKMQRPNDLPFPMENNMVLTDTPGNGGVPINRGGFCEYYRSDTNALNTEMHTKLMLALPFLKLLSEVTGDAQYLTWADEARNFLITGLTDGHERYFPISMWSGDNLWHRVTDGISEKYVYEDSMGYAIRSLLTYEGHSATLETAYETYNSLSGSAGYNPSIAWTGYLWPATSSSGSSYYDLTSIGILMEYRREHDSEAYRVSRQALQDHVDVILRYWSTDFSFEPNITEWQDTNGVSNIGEGILLTEPL